MEGYTILSEQPRAALVQNLALSGSRLDVDYYDPANVGPIITTRLTSPYPFRSLEEIADRIECYGAYALTRLVEFVPSAPEAVPYIRVGDFSNLTVSLKDCAHIAAGISDRLPKSKCKSGMVLITVSGTIGRVAVVPPYEGQINSSQHSIKISCKSLVNPYYVAALLDSSFGQAQMRREAGGAVQKELYLYNVKTLSVPIPDRRIQDYIGGKVELAERCRSEAKKCDDLLHHAFVSNSRWSE